MARIARDEETKKETFHEKEEEQLLREKRMFADKETFACDCKRDQRIEERPLSLLLWISLFLQEKNIFFSFPSPLHNFLGGGGAPYNGTWRYSELFSFSDLAGQTEEGSIKIRPSRQQK